MYDAVQNHLEMEIPQAWSEEDAHWLEGQDGNYLQLYRMNKS